MSAAKRRDTSNVLLSRSSRESRRGCWFCENEIDPDYKSVDVVKSFLSPRGKILSRKITGICAKHQRLLSSAIKLARHLALVR